MLAHVPPVAQRNRPHVPPARDMALARRCRHYAGHRALRGSHHGSVLHLLLQHRAGGHRTHGDDGHVLAVCVVGVDREGERPAQVGPHRVRVGVQVGGKRGPDVRGRVATHVKQHAAHPRDHRRAPHSARRRAEVRRAERHRVEAHGMVSLLPSDGRPGEVEACLSRGAHAHLPAPPACPPLGARRRVPGARARRGRVGRIARAAWRRRAVAPRRR
mmetsp:Transcript_31890/g.62260  ORF Transcript_31890/g.62260 Transcript_31890/m.62260 type:complete len:216 (-) Transcript_31890:316-963(-)